MGCILFEAIAVVPSWNISIKECRMFCVMFVVCLVCLYLWLNLAYQISWQINFYPDLNITHIFHSSFNHISISFRMYHSQKIFNCLQNPIYLFIVITITCVDWLVLLYLWSALGICNFSTLIYFSFRYQLIFISFYQSIFLYYVIKITSILSIYLKFYLRFNFGFHLLDIFYSLQTSLFIAFSFKFVITVLAANWNVLK